MSNLSMPSSSSLSTSSSLDEGSEASTCDNIINMAVQNEEGITQQTSQSKQSITRKFAVPKPPKEKGESISKKDGQSTSRRESQPGSPARKSSQSNPILVQSQDLHSIHDFDSIPRMYFIDIAKPMTESSSVQKVPLSDEDRRIRKEQNEYIAKFIMKYPYMFGIDSPISSNTGKPGPLLRNIFAHPGGYNSIKFIEARKKLERIGAIDRLRKRTPSPRSHRGSFRATCDKIRIIGSLADTAVPMKDQPKPSEKKPIPPPQRPQQPIIQIKPAIIAPIAIRPVDGQNPLLHHVSPIKRTMQNDLTVPEELSPKKFKGKSTNSVASSSRTPLARTSDDGATTTNV